jgi:hypothetical protein
MRPGVRERHRVIGQLFPSQRSSTVTPDGAATFSRVTRAPRGAKYPRMRTTGNGRRNRGATGPATSTAAGAGTALTGSVPADANVGAGVTPGVGDGVGSGVVAPGVGVGVGVGVAVGDGDGAGGGGGGGATTGAVGDDLTSMVKVSIVALAVTMSRNPTSAATGT